MGKYDKLNAAIKNDRKKSAQTVNQELLKMFLSKEGVRSGAKKLFDHKGKKPTQMQDDLMTTLMRKIATLEFLLMHLCMVS
jgi:hypothetical protein